MKSRPFPAVLSFKTPALRQSLAAAGLAFACGPATDAADAQHLMLVSAQVRPIARLESQSAPAMLDVSALDLQRGWLDVSAPVSLRISTNSRAGYVLDLLPVAPLFNSVAVAGLDSDVTLGADGGELVQRWQQARPVELALRFRFTLASGLAPGSYPWPILFRVRPLESL
jgi:hypothetical protein